MMLTLDSGLQNEKIRIDCKYYELEEKCMEITKAYCLENEQNETIFYEFSKNYHAFRPYFDFVVCYLHYQVINPQMEEGKLLIGKENHMYVYDSTKQQFENGFRYGLSDDCTLDIYPMSLDSSTFHDCLIDGKNQHILPRDMAGHVHISQQILNMLLISNQKVCEEYQKCNTDIGLFIQRYYPLLRFQSDRQGPSVITRGIYRKDNITKRQKTFLSDLLDNRYTYSSCWLDAACEDHYQYAEDLSETLEYKEGRKDASKRF